MHLDFLVQRKGIDPTAETCHHALREIMRLAVCGVESGFFWRFIFDDAQSINPEVQAKIERAASRAARYVNVNRDRVRWLHDRRNPLTADATGCVVDVWIREGDGRDAIALHYFRTRGIPGLVDLQRGTLYRLYLLESNAARARTLAEEITFSRSRTQGLLMNPHIHTAEILSVLSGPAAAEAH